MLCLFAVLQMFFGPSRLGLFESAGLYLVKATAVKTPAHPRLLGDTTLRVDVVLIGPKKIRGAVAIYESFTPKRELQITGGSQYSGQYPDFAYPAPKGQTRYWWASPGKDDGWQRTEKGSGVKNNDSRPLFRALIVPVENAREAAVENEQMVRQKGRESF